jgi:hypothetical protein
VPEAPFGVVGCQRNGIVPSSWPTTSPLLFSPLASLAPVIGAETSVVTVTNVNLP